ncbi:exonuclease SbcC [Flavobacterium sp. 7E]|uniref:AAA family ATPase n=1 Tax=Flavobacterium sp. 7E TaxID=2735898 RepID=UPI001570D673|nr:AAA family ATPase [Flavobacterium sp. 7E]NRS88864.1 exonuclease SbcC [Flavobacterium sp. 7E]
MKICKIKFKNIHALKGEHTIDFENGILGEAGLFVITGATGTGKSTLLDVITLALYNKIPRIDKAISEKVIEDEGVILTKNAPDCYAEVEYEVKGERYLSSWSIRRTRTGSLDKRKQELIKLSTGAILVSGVQEVVSENERIIGLNYNQFVQSMILAQGQFSKLLLAKKDDRNALLEEITGSSIYRKIGRSVFQRFRGVEDAVKTQNIKMGETILLTTEMVTEIQEDVLLQKPLLAAQQNHHDVLAKKKIVKENILKNAKLKEANEIEWTAFAKDKAAFVTQENELKTHDSLVVFKDQMLFIANAEKKVEELLESSTVANNKLSQQEKVKAELILIANSLIKKEVIAEKFEAEITDFRTRVLALQEAEKNSLSHAKQQSQRIEDKRKELIGYGITLTIDDTLSQQIQAELTTIDAGISQKGITSVDAARSKKEDLTRLMIPANQLIGDRKLFDEKNKGIGELQLKIKKQQDEIVVLISLEKSQQETLAKLLPKVELAKDALDDWKQRKSLDEHRQELKDGKPCPLCGSETHPFAQEIATTLVNSLEENFQSLTKQLEGLQKVLLENEVKLQSLQNINATETVTLDHRIAEFKILENKITELCTQLKWTTKDSLEKWQLDANDFQRELKELDKLENHIKAKVVFKEMVQLFTDYLELKKGYNEAKQTLLLVYDRKDITNEISKLSNDFSSCHSTIKSLKEQLTDLQKNKTETIKEKEELLANLLPRLEEKGIASLKELKAKILDENTASQIRKNLQLLVENEVRLKTDKKTIDKALEDDKILDDASITLEQITVSLPKIFEEITVLNKHIWDQENKIEIDIKNREKLKDSQKIMDGLQKDLALWSKMNLLIGDATGKKFSNFVQDLTLKQLLEYGNQRLIGFSDRYLLDTANDSDGLKVIDTYMGNTKRSVSSLSGGETFKLSLALAFGLSDLAARNVSIESLFIDEGFGSLDPESLDQAISILENMQNESNKSIGIISHVGELKDRIGTKIKLVRTGAGYSTIEIE